MAHRSFKRSIGQRHRARRHMEPKQEPIDASEETIRSLAAKLERYAGTLTSEDRALLHHVLLTALRPSDRRRLAPETGVFSDADLALLDSLALQGADECASD